MMNVRCDEMEIGKGTLENGVKSDDFSNLKCFLDVNYTTKVDKEFLYLKMSFSVKIANSDYDLINYYIPYTLKYSIEKYETYSLDEIAKSAVNEVSMDAYDRLFMVVTVFYHKKLEACERSWS